MNKNDLRDKNDCEIAFFNDDTIRVTYRPKGKYIFKHEQYSGENSLIDRFFIIHIDDNGEEIERWNALSSTVTFIKWA